MADWAIRKRNDINDWTLVSGFHDLGGGTQGIEDGEVGVISVTLDLTTTSGSGGIGGGQDGFYLDIDTSNPIISEAGLPNGFQMLTFGSAYGYNDFLNILTAQSINVTVAALGIPSSTAGTAYTFSPPPDNADLFGAIVVEFTITAPVSGQITYDPSSVGETVFTVGGTYDTLAPGDPVDGFYASRNPGIRAGEDATLLTNIELSTSKPRAPRGMITYAPFSEGRPFWGYPGHGVTIGNKFYYAAGGYELGVDHPTIRVWDGNTDTEVCKVPVIHNTIMPIAITCMIAMTDRFIVFGTFEPRPDPMDSTGSILRLRVADGTLEYLGVSGGLLGHIPSALLFANGRLFVATATTDNSPGLINGPIGNITDLSFTIAGVKTYVNVAIDLPTQGSVVSMIADPLGSAFLFGTAAQAPNAGAVYRFGTVFDGLQTTPILDGDDFTASPVDYNGFYALGPKIMVLDSIPGRVHGGFISNIAAYWNPDDTSVMVVQNGDPFQGDPGAVVFTDPTNTQIMNIVIDGLIRESGLGPPGGGQVTSGTAYAFAAKRVSGAYSGYVVWNKNIEDATDWTDATAQLVMSNADVTLASRAPTNCFGVVVVPEETE